MIQLTGLLEEGAALGLDMIDVEDARGLSAEQSLQARLPFDQRQVPKVLAVQAEQVERKEQALATPEQQVVEDRPPRTHPRKQPRHRAQRSQRAGSGRSTERDR